MSTTMPSSASQSSLVRPKGMMMSSVRLATIFAKAAPMITATARSRTLPLAMKARNSLSICIPLLRVAGQSVAFAGQIESAGCVAELRQH